MYITTLNEKMERLTSEQYVKNYTVDVDDDTHMVVASDNKPFFVAYGNKKISLVFNNQISVKNGMLTIMTLGKKGRKEYKVGGLTVTFTE